MTYKEKMKNLYGRVKIDLIPNVSEFNTFIESYSAFAAIFGLKSPNRKNTVSQFNELKKVNKYIIKQNYRLMKYAAENQMDKHDYLSKIILEKSDAFLVMSIHHKGQSNKGKGPKWFENSWSKVVSLVNKTRRVSKGDVKLEFKRVWIDKLPGDYARPLGAVRRWWATYTFNINRQIEHTLIAKNLLTPWQHGGRASKGTHTAWEKVMFVLKSKPFIFEFDIKGFYDNIITTDCAPFLGPELKKRVQEIVNQTIPSEYNLPPEDKDKGYQNYLVIKNHACEALSPWKNSPNYNLYVEDYIADMMREDFGMGNLPKLEFPDSIRLESIYKELMGDKYPSYPMRNRYGMTEYVDPSLRDRERGREYWKNLSQIGRGYPQGLSFSPILSTNSLERLLSDVSSSNLTMYMDDGLIYGETKDEVLQIINKLETALAHLGIALAPEKSGWIRDNWTFVKSSKFLAIRIKEDGTLISETRKGTRRAFPNPLNWWDYEEFCNHLEINASAMRITYKEIYEPKGKEQVIWLGNCMGNILNYMYAPNIDGGEQEEKIIKGKVKAMQRILRNRHKTLDKLEKYFPESITRIGLGERLEAVRIGSISSIAACRLLRYLKVKRNKRRVRA